MDKLLGAVGNLSTLITVLRAINKTTDDYLFVLDIATNKNWFFGSIDAKFAVRRPGSEVNTFEEMLEVVHPADRAKLCEDIRQIREGIKDFHDMNYRWISRSGETVWISCRGRVVHDAKGKPSMLVGRVSEEALRHLYDPLTGLWKKTKLLLDLKTELAASEGCHLMYLSIPELTDISLSHGSRFGDRLLREAADFIETIDGVKEFYHIDHNCFALILDAAVHGKEAEIYRRINREMREHCSFAAGIVPIDRGLFMDVPQLIDSASVTLAHAEDTIGERLEFFSAADIESRVEALTLLEELTESVQNGFEGFELWYQPQVTCGSLTLHGVEALLRYTSKKRGRVFPDAFIPLLEQSRLIEPVGMWVLEEALRQCKKWRRDIPALRVSVNFSTVQFEDRAIGEKIVDALRRIGLSGDALTVELTESAQLGQDKNIIEQLRSIKSHGVRLSIDDFGTGYSNLGYFTNLDVNEVKIDRSFISGIERNSYNYNLISNVIEFARANGIHTCGEGVETIDELLVAETLGLDILQGYLFDKPCTAAEITEKYIRAGSEAYSARMEQIEEIHQAREERGEIRFDPQGILNANDVGLWVVRVHKERWRYELHADETMQRLLGLREKRTPQDCYAYWNERIDAEQREYVNEKIKMLVQTGSVVQMTYLWEHPELGTVSVRSCGIRTMETDTMIVLEGYHRILSDNREV